MNKFEKVWYIIFCLIVNNVLIINTIEKDILAVIFCNLMLVYGIYRLKKSFGK